MGSLILCIEPTTLCSVNVTGEQRKRCIETGTTKHTACIIVNDDFTHYCKCVCRVHVHYCVCTCTCAYMYCVFSESHSKNTVRGEPTLCISIQPARVYSVKLSTYVWDGLITV